MATMNAGTGLHVLIVDDNVAIGRWLRLLLEAEGACVDVVDSGPDALRFLEKGLTYDLVLLDVRMPNWDGPTTLTRIRVVRGPQFVAFMTGDPGGYTPEQLLRLGADAILMKPIALSELADCLRRASRIRGTG
jgi:CheY-like chemotaxis protein